MINWELRSPVLLKLIVQLLKLEFIVCLQWGYIVISILLRKNMCMPTLYFAPFFMHWLNNDWDSYKGMWLFMHSIWNCSLVNMYHAKTISTATLVPHKPQVTNQHANTEYLGVSPASNSVNSRGSSKQRLRWTSDLHDRFVDAISQLGGPDSEYLDALS